MLKKMVMFFGSVIAFASSAQALPRCSEYAPADREEVREILEMVDLGLGRLREISILLGVGATWGLDLSSTQRLAVENEKIAYLMEFERLRTSTGQLRPRSRLFVARVLDQRALGITGITLLGSTPSEAIQNSVAANAAVVRAQSRLWDCF
jgi:hypothetical protein